MTFRKGDPNNPGVKFQKGVAYNPRGRSPQIIEVAKLARERTTEAIETLTAIMRDKKATSSARVSAAVAILERAWGKAPQTIDLRREVDMKALSDEELVIIAIGTAAESDSSAGVIESAPYEGKPH